MVRYDYRQRYYSAADALEAFNELSTVYSQTTVTETKQKRSPGKLMIGLAIAAVLAISIAYWYLIPRPKPPENFLTYGNSSLGITIKYPQSWERLNIDNLITGEVVAFVSAKQTDADKFQEKLTISVEDFSGTL